MMPPSVLGVATVWMLVPWGRFSGIVSVISRIFVSIVVIVSIIVHMRFWSYGRFRNESVNKGASHRLIQAELSR